ncbi:terpene synthase family protein [Streptomyces sp. URMC 124]|uniref:terpene synthase family protein n=1 Tax=Streptomyces sp. URMC 124 TaxID=3423405 RepID=UPI003F1B6CEB
MSPVPRYRPPVTDLPEPERVSPHLDEAAAFTDRWVRRTGLIQSFSAQRRFRRARCVDLAARVAPQATCPRLQRTAAWIVWFHALDDRCRHPRGEEYAFGFGALPDFLPPDGGPTPPARTALQRALADVWRMTAPAMSPAWRERFAARFRELADRRLWDALAAGSALDLVEYVCERELPAPVRGLASFRSVSGAATAVLARGGAEAETEAETEAEKEAAAEAEAEAFRGVLHGVAAEAARAGLPPAALSAVSAYLHALALWADGRLAWARHGGTAGSGAPEPGGHRPLLLADDVTCVPVDLLRPRRPAPPPVPSTSGGAGTALHRGRE